MEKQFTVGVVTLALFAILVVGCAGLKSGRTSDPTTGLRNWVTYASNLIPWVQPVLTAGCTTQSIPCSWSQHWAQHDLPIAMAALQEAQSALDAYAKAQTASTEERIRLAQAELVKSLDVALKLVYGEK